MIDFLFSLSVKHAAALLAVSLSQFSRNGICETGEVEGGDAEGSKVESAEFLPIWPLPSDSFMIGVRERAANL